MKYKLDLVVIEPSRKFGSNLAKSLNNICSLKNAKKNVSSITLIVRYLDSVDTQTFCYNTYISND